MKKRVDKVEPLPVEDLETQPLSKLDVRPSQTNKFRKDPLRVYCLHQTEESDGHSSVQRSSKQANPFEVVPDTGDGVDIVHIVYGGGETIDGPDELKIISKQKDKKVYTIECRHKSVLGGNFVSRDFWRGVKSSKKVNLKCGKRDVQIRTYDPRKHWIVFKIPEIGLMSGGRKIGDKRDKKGKVDQVDNTKTRTNSWKPWGKIEPPDSATYESDTPPPIRYSVDGVPVEQNFLEVVGGILQLGRQILKIYQSVRDNVPKVGWYFTADIQLMQGTFNFSWKWKEYRDHRAFLWVGVLLDLDILSLSFEIGVGINGFAFDAQLYGKLEGSVGVSTNLQRTSPKVSDQVEISIDAKIMGELGARCRVGNSVEMIAKLQTALKSKGLMVIDTEKGPSIKVENEWTGIAGVVVGSVGFFGVMGYKKKENVTVVDESSLGVWSWPDKKGYNPGKISNNKVKSILEQSLEEGFFDKTRVKTKDGKYVGSSSIASILTREIDGRGVLRDEKTIQALSHNIKQELERIESGGWAERDALSYERFKTFCNQELPELLTNYVDPMAESKEEMCYQ